MKLLIKEYLSALKERGELDVVLPDLLSEMGLHVFSRPAIGIRQNGVDLAAVGTDGDGTKKVFLFTIKSGNLTRADWNGTLQAVRPSLDEILDSYVPRRIPKQYAGLPVAICVCVGGDIEQNVDADLSDYEARHTKDGIEFQRWDGDQLANLILSAVLGEKVISGEARSYFRKSVAMLDEPEAAYQYFAEMLGKLSAGKGGRQKDIVTLVRQLNLCCWILYAWSREANNLEAPYRCSELAMLWGWDLTAPFLGKSSASAKSMATAMTNLIRLHLSIANEFITQKLLPHADVRDGLATAVNSRFSLDVNLRLFESIGRLAMTGIWLQFFVDRNTELSDVERHRLHTDLGVYCDGLINILNNNGILQTPIIDTHSIEVNLVCFFLTLRKRMDVIRDWAGQILPACIFALRTNSAYPCVHTEYHRLAEHPKSRSDKDYFEKATAGSTLIPTLCVWQKLANPAATFVGIPDFLSKELPHCTLQLWVPNRNTETHLYTNSDIHGLAVLGLPITETCDELLEIVFEECQHNQDPFNSLSAIKIGYWPIVLAACRHHRICVPITFWSGFDSLESQDQ